MNDTAFLNDSAAALAGEDATGAPSPVGVVEPPLPVVATGLAVLGAVFGWLLPLLHAASRMDAPRAKVAGKRDCTRSYNQPGAPRPRRGKVGSQGDAAGRQPV